MKKILPIIITIVLICAVVVLLVIRGAKPGKETDSSTDGRDTGSVVTGIDDADLAETDPMEVEIGEDFTIELEENQAVGGF